MQSLRTLQPMSFKRLLNLFMKIPNKIGANTPPCFTMLCLPHLNCYTVLLFMESLNNDCAQYEDPV